MRITSKGQVTVPKHIRDKLGIGPGDDIGFREEGQAVIVEVRPTPDGSESNGAKFARALIEMGQRARRDGWIESLTADELMTMARGPFDDVKSR
jgi:AbrB family looped-hinge helix DNA binding protein